MADFEEKVKAAADQAKDVTRAVADQAKDLTRVAVDDVKDEAELVKADAKGYAKDAFEDVKSEGKEVIQELKAAVKKEDLSDAKEGEAGYRAKEGDKPNGIAIASVVLGALSLIIPNTLITLLLGVVSIVLGAKARKENQTNLATWGFILGAVGIFIALINIIF